MQVINGRLMDELALPLELKGRLFSLTARTGHAVNQADDIIAQQILKRALGALGRVRLENLPRVRDVR